VTQIAATTMARQDHVIILRVRRSGQNLARLLDRRGDPFIAMDGDPSACASGRGRQQRRLHGTRAAARAC